MPSRHMPAAVPSDICWHATSKKIVHATTHSKPRHCMYELLVCQWEAKIGFANLCILAIRTNSIRLAWLKCINYRYAIVADAWLELASDLPP